MKIGMTYDLRTEYLEAGYNEDETAEFDREDTIEAIEQALITLGHRPDRIGYAKKLAERLVRGDRWDMVFNIAEGMHGIGREAQVPSLLDLYQIPYTFADPLVMSLTLDKAMTKRVIRDAGFPTAAFVTVERMEDLDRLDFGPPFFIKPLAEGTGKGITPDSVVRDRDRLWPACQKLLRTYRQPVLLEEYLPGRELTVGILGTGAKAEVLGTLEVFLLPLAEAEVYSYVNKERCEELVEYRLAKAFSDPVIREAEEVALGAWRALNCRDAGRVDIRCDSRGRPVFMEVNPLAGLHPSHSDLPILCSQIGIPYLTLIERIVLSAGERVQAAGTQRRR